MNEQDIALNILKPYAFEDNKVYMIEFPSACPTETALKIAQMLSDKAGHGIKFLPLWGNMKLVSYDCKVDEEKSKK